MSTRYHQHIRNALIADHTPRINLQFVVLRVRKWFEWLIGTDLENADLLYDCEEGCKGSGDKAFLPDGELAVVNGFDGIKDPEEACNL